MATFKVGKTTAALARFETIELGELRRLKEVYDIAGQVELEQRVYAFDPDAWTAYLDLSLRRSAPDVEIGDSDFDRIALVPLQRAFEEEEMERARIKAEKEAEADRPTPAGTRSRKKKTPAAAGARS